MKVIANRQLHGDYGDLRPDEPCEMHHDLASALLKGGLVRVPAIEAPSLALEKQAYIPDEAQVATPEQPRLKIIQNKRK